MDIPPRRYFDWAATAPGLWLDNTTINDQFAKQTGSSPSPWLGVDLWPGANPSSLHAEGRAARAALEEARSRCACVLGVKGEELFFTSGGTESNAIVLFSLLSRPRRNGKGAELLYWGAEHPSIRENAAALEGLGVRSAVLPSDIDGRVSEAILEAALAKNPAPRMAAVMAVNNETGALNDMKALTALLRNRNAPPVHLHCDLVQAVGKIPLDLYGWGIDSASISAHKLGGPRGMGLLWLKKPLVPLVRGGGQERKIRPGTENTFGAMALALALEARALKAQAGNGVLARNAQAAERMAALSALLRKTGSFIPLPSCRADHDRRFSPWILQCAFYGETGTGEQAGGERYVIPGEVMVRALDERGFALSTGSACSAAEKERPVLDSMGIDRTTALGGIRISQGWSTTMDDIEALAAAIAELCSVL